MRTRARQAVLLVLVAGLAACSTVAPGPNSSTPGPSHAASSASTNPAPSVSIATGAIGTLIAGTPRPTSAATALPAPTSATVTFTRTDNGASVAVRVGTTIEVQLAASGPPYQWSDVVSSDENVVHRTASAQHEGDSRATFVVVRPGQVTLSATDDPHCAPACGAPSRLWQVKVIAKS